MLVFLTIIYIAVMIALFIAVGVRPQLTTHSAFELRRRIAKGDREAEYLLHRNELLPDVFSLQRVTTAVLLVVLSAIGVVLFHWFMGVVVTLFIALEAGAIARLSFLQTRSQKLYDRYESKIFSLIERYPKVFRAIHIVSPVPADTYDIESREELLHMVEQSGNVLSVREKKLILNGLEFDAHTVSEIMVSRSAMHTIDAGEVLGPLVLDDMFKTGHSRIPVIEGSIDNVVGVLYLRDLMSVHAHKETYTAKDAMDKHIFYIREDQSLWHALAAFIRTHHHLFVVINKERETVGLVTLEDCMEALLGRKIIDEFEDHHDASMVAARDIPKNNTTKNGTTV